MKNKSILTTLALSSFLLTGCCALHCNCKNSPKKCANTSNCATPVLVNETANEETAPTSSQTTVEDKKDKKVGWEMWALAGGVVAVGVVLALSNKKKTTKV